MFNVDDFKARLLSARKEAYNTKTKKKGYSQEEAAELLIGEGGKRSTVAAWENPNRKNLPSVESLLKIADLYDVDVRYLLDEKREEPNVENKAIASVLNLSIENVVTLKNNPQYSSIVSKIIGKELFEQIVNKINNLALSSVLKDVILTSFTVTFSKKLSKMFDSYYFQELTISINQSGFLDFIKKNIPYDEKSFDADEFLEKNFLEEGRGYVYRSANNWNGMKTESKYDHLMNCVAEITFDYFLSTKTQELLKVNINNTFSQLIDEVVEERNQEIHERFKEKAEKYISE